LNPEFWVLPKKTRRAWYYSSRGEGYDLKQDLNSNLDFRIENLADYRWTLEEFIADLLEDRDMNNSGYGGYYVNPEVRIPRVPTARDRGYLPV
jgi:hypothetical protein